MPNDLISGLSADALIAADPAAAMAIPAASVEIEKATAADIIVVLLKKDSAVSDGIWSIFICVRAYTSTVIINVETKSNPIIMIVGSFPVKLNVLVYLHYM